MRRIIHVEDESHQPQPFWAAVALLLAGAYRIAAAILRAELFTQTETRQPLSVLDVMRSSRMPTIRLTRETIMDVSETHYADGLELTIWRRGAAWTLRAGQVGAYIASRADYEAFYGARGVSGQGKPRTAAQTPARG